jgi:hypothetical protein
MENKASATARFELHDRVFTRNPCAKYAGWLGRLSTYDAVAVAVENSHAADILKGDKEGNRCVTRTPGPS